MKPYPVEIIHICNFTELKPYAHVILQNTTKAICCEFTPLCDDFSVSLCKHTPSL